MTYVLCLILCPISYDLKALVYVLFLGLKTYNLVTRVDAVCLGRHVIFDACFIPFERHAIFACIFDAFLLYIPLEEPPHLTADYKQ